MEWMRKHMLITLAVTFLLGVGIGASGDNIDPVADTSAEEEEEEEQIPTFSDDEDEPEPEPKPKAKGDYGLSSCDADLSNDELIGSTKVINTGEVPAKLEVSFKWLLGNGTKLTASPKTVTLPPGRDRFVFFRYPADSGVIGSFQDHPAYFDSENCKTKAKIVN